MFKRKKKQQEEVLQQMEETKDETMVDEDFVASLETDINTKDEISFEEFDKSVSYSEEIAKTDVAPIELEEEEPQEEVVEEEIMVEEETSEPKDINSFFNQDEKVLEEIKKKPKKEKSKKKSKRSKKKERDLQDIQDRRIFKYKNKKYSKVSDFVNYLLDHYLEMDDIAKEVLDDENFYGWLSKNSAQFEESIKKFKEIKEKIEK
jgi:hypothetical protein